MECGFGYENHLPKGRIILGGRGMGGGGGGFREAVHLTEKI